jgi:hypothetical protein
MLDVNRQGFGDRGDRRLVPVIIMGVGDDNRIHVNDRFNGKRQFHQRVTQLAARGTGKARQAPLAESIGSIRNFLPAYSISWVALRTWVIFMMFIPLRGYLANIVRPTSLAQYGRLGNER